MSLLSLFLDVSPLAGGAGVFIAVALIFVALAAGFFAIVMLRKSIKMAIRLIVVALILLIAVVGSVSFLWFSTGDAPPRRPAANRTR